MPKNYESRIEQMWTMDDEGLLHKVPEEELNVGKELNVGEESDDGWEVSIRFRIDRWVCFSIIGACVVFLWVKNRLF